MAWTTPGTATAGEVLTAAFWNTQVRDNMVEVAPFFAADWTSWTPTFSGFTIGTGGSASSTGRYIKIGTMVIFWGVAVLGTSGTSVGDIFVNLPFTASDKGTINAKAEAVDTGTAVYPLNPTVEDSSTGSMRLLVPNVSGTYMTLTAVTSTIPFTWGAGDKLRFSGVIEAATP